MTEESIKRDRYARVVKLRPLEPLPGNFRDRDWGQILNKLGFESDHATIHRIKFSRSVSLGEYTNAVIEYILSCSDCDTLFVDVCFDRANEYQTYILDCLADVISRLHDGKRSRPNAVVILTSVEAVIGLSIRAMLDNLNVSGVVMLDGNCKEYGDIKCCNLYELRSLVRDKIRSDHFGYRIRRLRANVVRERGVYTHSGHIAGNSESSSRPTIKYFRYRYFFTKEGVDLIKDHIVDLIRSYGDEIKDNTPGCPPISHLVVDTSSSPWMKYVLDRLSKLDQVHDSLKLTVLDVNQTDRAYFSIKANGEVNDLRIAVITGVSRRGGTVNRVRDYFGLKDDNIVLRASVLADSRKIRADEIFYTSGAPDDDIKHGWNWISVGLYGWFYLLDVPVDEIEADGWEVHAGRILGEVIDLGDSSFQLALDADPNSGDPSQLVRSTKVGLLSFLAKVGASLETSCQSRPLRKPGFLVRYFPKVDDVDKEYWEDIASLNGGDLSFYDANWLGALALQEIRRIVAKSNSSNFVIVVPLDVDEEARGIDHIAYAMARTRNVRVVRMNVGSDGGLPQLFPIDNDQQLVKNWRIENFVLFDETVVTGNTMKAMKGKLDRFLDQPNVELCFSIFDLCCWSAEGTQDRSALYSWQYSGYVQNDSLKEG